MSADPNKKSARTFQCRDVLWETFEQMARELECSIDYLINESMKQYARQRSYSPRTPFPGATRDGAGSGQHPMALNQSGASPAMGGMPPQGGPPPMQGPGMPPAMHAGQQPPMQQPPMQQPPMQQPPMQQPPGGSMTPLPGPAPQQGGFGPPPMPGGYPSAPGQQPPPMVGAGGLPAPPPFPGGPSASGFGAPQSGPQSHPGGPPSPGGMRGAPPPPPPQPTTSKRPSLPQSLIHI